MKIEIDYNWHQGNVVIYTDTPESLEWKSLKRIIGDYIPEIIQNRVSMQFAWRNFLSIKGDVASFVQVHQVNLSISQKATELLKNAQTLSYNVAVKKGLASEQFVKMHLASAGFARNLTSNQLSNLRKLITLPAGATFSVPGAGKTTEALAYFYCNSNLKERLLVVAPKNAFGAWDEQLEICVPSETDKFIRLTGGESRIRNLLAENPRFMLITYQQFLKVKKLISQELTRSSVYMFLDESHRIKSGKLGVTAESILEVSYLPTKKLIMSGTPMPQSAKDLVPQFKFLYPEKAVTEDTAINLMQPIFVRTTKDQLGIPKLEHRLILLNMDEIQLKIYGVLKSELKRQLNSALSDDSKYALRHIGKSSMKILQFVSNPALLANDMNYAFDPRMGQLLLTCNGPKIEYACKRARILASEGKKVIIWSTFVENVELISERLQDLGADYIHGGVDTGDENIDDTREGKIKRFHNDPNAMVLVANPSAASEGISLHKVCQYAIYVDRSFNAAHYLQSEDRIHRLGLKQNQHPIVEIVECSGTIDQVVRRRLQDKVAKMSEALNDPSLIVDTIPYDFEGFGDESSDITPEDAKAVLNYFFSGDES
ncbi:DEAD/DEAH box helicase [Marasmitruncus massiliensis]|uniref:SNF2-related protein n=1 Tax=Marasmitruncus massiliensis TaxID=1944642 RepID=UPI000C7BE226|nr:DEAD/DEAH box helicase [Marasmitruncus massiliensis]